jgi:uncharacterized membrane protein (DUF485 family)
MHESLNERILKHPEYRPLVERRRAFARRQVSLAVLIWLGYLLFNILSRHLDILSPERGMTLHVLAGAAVMIGFILLVKAYTRRAEEEFDVQMAEIRRELRQAAAYEA